MDADGGGQTQLTSAPNIGGENPNWSPDGRRIVFDSTANSPATSTSGRWPPDGNGQTRLTNSPALDALPAYSPNGRSIVFVSDRTAKDNREFFVMAKNCSQRRLLRDPRRWDMSPDWGERGPPGSRSRERSTATI